MLFSRIGKIWVGQRIDSVNAWQMPQGGIDKNENSFDAAIRELKEETGFNPISMFVVDHVSNFYEAHQDRINLVPVFGIEVDNEIVTLSKEHCEFKWLEFDLAYKMLVWRGQKEGISAVYNMLNSSDERIRWSKILL